CNVVHFSEFSPNPKVEDVKKALVEFQAFQPRKIIAVGGGSALDVAKLVRYFAATGIEPEEPASLPNGNSHHLIPLLAVPTTAGSGSEATHFAVIYKGFIKHSVAHPSLRPSHVWLNPRFTMSASPYQVACSGFDAFAQGIESLWAVGATENSKLDSSKAITLCLRHLEGAVLARSPQHCAGMLEAANLSGQAINVSKTTAAHAMSYALTAHYGLPHGHAVAMILPAVFEANAAVTDRNVNDPRGAAFVHAALRELCTRLGCTSVPMAVRRIRELMAGIGLSETWFSSHGFNLTTVRNFVTQEVNLDRLANNPRRLDAEAFAQILAQIR
ncbi:MAG: phosphonoacetaldehyde reductase, partial [Limisphaerales bacterium]